MRSSTVPKILLFIKRPSPRLKKKKPSAKKKSLPVQKRKDNVTPRRHDSLVFLGPTTYNVLEPEAPLLHIQGPNEGFLSTSERMKPDAFVTPPPNSYNVSEYRAHRVQGGNSLQYRSKRLTADDHEAKKSPGPATYQRETRATPREGVGKIIRGRPPRLGPKEGPSIPSGRGVFGFEIDNTGEVAKLVPVLIKESDKLPSPTEKYEGGEKYKGIFWSKRTAQRDSTEDEKLNISPGPAAYSLEKPPPTFREKMDKYIKDINKKYANLPRYLEKEQQAIIKENIPSPSAYDISIKTKINLKKDGSKLGTFGNTTRFKTVIKEGPGPGYYEENRKICAKEFCYSANKLKTVKDIPFLTTEKRFEKLVKEEVISNIEHCKRDNVKLINYWVEEGKKKAAFSSTEPRFKLDFPESPDPDQYTIDGMASLIRRRVERRKVAKKTSPFDSSEERFKVKKEFEHYCMWDETYYFGNRFNEPLEIKKQRPQKLKRKVTRLDKYIAKYIDSKKPPPREKPGPTTYNPRLLPSKIKGGTFPKSEIKSMFPTITKTPRPGARTRFKTVIKEGPGPGYEDKRKIAVKKEKFPSSATEQKKSEKDIPILTPETKFEKPDEEDVKPYKRDKLIKCSVEKGKKRVAFSFAEPRCKLESPKSPDPDQHTTDGSESRRPVKSIMVKKTTEISPLKFLPYLTEETSDLKKERDLSTYKRPKPFRRGSC